MTRVLMSVAGSAGDLFPLVPVAQRLVDEGHDVRCAVVPRSLAFALRPLGIPAVGLGSGGEVTALREPGVVTTRFGGWASLRRLALSLHGSLDDDVAALEDLARTWRPDVVASASLAPSARIVAHRRGVPHAGISVHPMMAPLAGGSRFAVRLLRRCAELAGLSAEVAPDELAQLAWGVGPRTLMLHDPSLLDAMGPRVSRALSPDALGGFPGWDGALHRAADTTEAHDWLDRSADPVVMVTMGSYLGAGRRQTWREAAEAVSALGVRGLLVGSTPEVRDAVSGLDGDFHTARHLPFAEVLGRVDVLVHHGGVGTMFAALRAGTPSVVRPIAFDQPFNADLLERAGAGVRLRGPLRPALEEVLSTPAFAERCRASAGRLVPTDAAAERAARHIVGTATGSPGW